MSDRVHILLFIDIIVLNMASPLFLGCLGEYFFSYFYAVYCTVFLAKRFLKAFFSSYIFPGCRLKHKFTV